MKTNPIKPHRCDFGKNSPKQVLWCEATATMKSTTGLYVCADHSHGYRTGYLSPIMDAPDVVHADAQKIAWKLAAKWKRRHSELLGYVEHSRAYEVNRCMNELKRAFKIKP